MITMLYPFRPKRGDHAYFGYQANGNHVIPPPQKQVTMLTLVTIYLALFSSHGLFNIW